jgi:hypothetical protein
LDRSGYTLGFCIPKGDSSLGKNNYYVHGYCITKEGYSWAGWVTPLATVFPRRSQTGKIDKIVKMGKWTAKIFKMEK